MDLQVHPCEFPRSLLKPKANRPNPKTENINLLKHKLLHTLEWRFQGLRSKTFTIPPLRPQASPLELLGVMLRANACTIPEALRGLPRFSLGVKKWLKGLVRHVIPESMSQKVLCRVKCSQRIP